MTDVWTASKEAAEIIHVGEDIFTKGIDFTSEFLSGGVRHIGGPITWGHRIEIHADSADEAEELALKITNFLNEVK